MESATKFVDFFVHDILDFSMLNKEVSKFNKNITLFNVKQAVEEIVQTLYDKTQLVNIDVHTTFIGFYDHYMVKTDQKRMQQILLNLYSNAIKFTQRFGKIIVQVEKVPSNPNDDI